MPGLFLTSATLPGILAVAALAERTSSLGPARELCPCQSPAREASASQA